MLTRTSPLTPLPPSTLSAGGSLRIEASLADYRRLLTWGRRWPQRKWVVQNANGLGRLAQWLLARGESVVDESVGSPVAVAARMTGSTLPPQPRPTSTKTGVR